MKRSPVRGGVATLLVISTLNCVLTVSLPASDGNLPAFEAVDLLTLAGIAVADRNIASIACL